MNETFYLNHRYTLLNTFRIDVTVPLLIILISSNETNFLRHLMSLVGVLIICFCLLFLLNNRQRLIIHGNTVTTYYEWFGKKLGFKEIELTPDLMMVTINKQGQNLFSLALNGRFIYGRKYKLFFCNKEKMVFTFDTRQWLGMNRGELIKYYEQLGFTLRQDTSTSLSKQLNTDIPANQDMGKRAGYLAYTTILLAIISFLIFFFDSFVTAYTPEPFPYLMTVGVLVFILSMFYMYTEKKFLLFHGLVALIFSACMTWMVGSLFYFFVSIFGSSQVLAFEKKTDVRWVAVDDAKTSIECFKPITKYDIGTIKSIETKELFTVVKTKKEARNEICEP